MDRAIAALEVLAELGDAGTGVIADKLGVHKSSASRILTSLASHGLVEQDGQGGSWRLGFGLVRLAGSVTARTGFSQVAQVLCDRVVEDLGMTANVAVLDEGFAVNVSQAVGSGLLAPRHYVGLRTPGHATSSGKLLLAYSGTDGTDGTDRTEVPDDLERYTDRTILTASELGAELDWVRDRGWAASDEEWEERITAVAVPLRRQDGTVEAALTVTGPNHRLPPQDFPEVAARLTELARSSGRWV